MVDGGRQVPCRTPRPSQATAGSARRRLARAAWVGWLTACVLGAAGSLAVEPMVPQDAGAAGAWHRLLKLPTIASVMHTTAHPDDEHGGVLTWLSRGEGARVSLLSLTRGEAGDNAIGPELFDALGLIRTEELILAGKYYGLDQLYFTSAADFGFSKRLDEALETWGRDALVGDMVRLMRVERPLVVVSRFQGNERDGHGQHQAAGVITRLAFEAAGDPARFPEQLTDGLRPWQPRRLYIGGVREDETWDVRVDSGRYSPALGESFEMFARRGLSFQRSQNGGRLSPTAGPAYRYYRRVDGDAPARGEGFFVGMDVGLTGMLSLDGESTGDDGRAILEEAARHVATAQERFEFGDPSQVVPPLRDALIAIRRARQVLAERPEARAILARKEQQIEEAIGACLGVRLRATAVPAGEGSASPAPFAPLPTLPPIVPGQSFDVQVTFGHERATALDSLAIDLVTPVGWRVERGEAWPGRLARGDTAEFAFSVRVPLDALPTRVPFTRTSIAESRYSVADGLAGQPFAPAELAVRATYAVEGVPVEMRQAVRRWESNQPYGFESREVSVVPALSVTVEPRYAVVPAGGTGATRIRAELMANQQGGVAGEVRLEVPEGWSAEPSREFGLSAAGDRDVVEWTVTRTGVAGGDYRFDIVATAAGREFREGLQVIRHRDLEPRILYHPATSIVRVVDVDLPPALTVGYVMGIGDEVPAAIAQLGATVEMLDDESLSTDDLGRFDAIVTGTRAYAVRAGLVAGSRRLLEYVERGGNLIVLYNTAELVPDSHAPYPGRLPARSEEVTEEDSAVQILAPDHPVLRWPNAIGPSDFDGWIEQRGSKFWSEWDARYTAILSTQDAGQSPQRGGWLTARHGDGHYTYFAYALHRQLPYGVPGAYRLLANLLSLSRQPRP